MAESGTQRLSGPSKAWAAIGVALLLIGVGLVALAVALETPLEAEVVGGNTPVNEGAGDLTDIRAHNSPAMARSPVDGSQVVVGSRVDTPRFSCALHVSSDGGVSWSTVEVPIPAGEEDKCYAPTVAFDAAGTLYAAYVTLEGRGNTPSAVWLVSSDDGGQTLSQPTRVGGDLQFQVHLAADPVEPDRLYLTWLDADNVATLSLPEPGQPIVAASSDDGGQSWSDPVQLSDEAHERAVAGSPTIADDGTWYVAYLDLVDDRLNYHGAHEGRGGPPPQGPWRLVVARSADGGESWGQTVVDELVPTERFLVFLPPLPQLAVDGDDVYVAFHDGRANADGSDEAADVWLWASRDGGRSWGEARRVNGNPAGDGTRQYLPQVAVAPTGRVDVVYYDRRGDPDENVFTEASLQASADGGESFTDRVVLSEQAFDSRIGFGSFRDLPEIGNRLALESTADQALAVWADTRAGTEASGKQDLTQAMVAFSGGPAASPVMIGGLRYGGLVAAALGLVVHAGAVLAYLRRRSETAPAGKSGEAEPVGAAPVGRRE